MTTNTFDFIAGNHGEWKVINMNSVCGPDLEMVKYINILPNSTSNLNQGVWTLTGFTSNVRYAEKEEREKLIAVQPDLGRPFATCAALIPIRKTESWWNMAQDERRKIFEAKSHHTGTGLKYLNLGDRATISNHLVQH